MRGVKIDIILSWNDDGFCSAKFMRGRDMESWQNMTREEQENAVNAMISMGAMFAKFIKDESEDAK